MKICKMRMENFRSFKDETIDLTNYNCFVGPNGSGKSTVLSALNIFFRNTMTATGSVGLNEEDFHNKDTSQQIIITVWFDELNDGAKEELSAYVRQGLLVVKAKATWDEISAVAVVEQYGSRLVINDFKKYFEADKSKASATALKDIYSGFGGHNTNITRTRARRAVPLRRGPP